MSIIGVSDLEVILDKAARHAAEAIGDSNVVTSPNAGITVANASVLAALQTAVKGLTDAGQVADLLPAVYNLASGPPGISGLLGSAWARVFDAVDRHCRRFAYNTLDDYLSFLNVTTPTLRAHGDLAAYIRSLSPGNVFTPANAVLMHITVTGATTMTPVHVAALDTTKYGKGEIKVLNTKTEGLTSTVLTFPKAQKNGADHSVVATITVQTDQHLTVFDDTDLAFTDVLVTSATISGGNAGDTFDIVVVPDRSIASA